MKLHTESVECFRDYFNRTVDNELYYDYVFSNKTSNADRKVIDLVNDIRYVLQ